MEGRSGAYNITPHNLSIFRCDAHSIHRLDDIHYLPVLEDDADIQTKRMQLTTQIIVLVPASGSLQTRNVCVPYLNNEKLSRQIVHDSFVELHESHRLGSCTCIKLGVKMACEVNHTVSERQTNNHVTQRTQRKKREYIPSASRRVILEEKRHTRPSR
jgi:hypothetical protein